MKHDLPRDGETLGADLRALRKARGLTLTEIAARLDRSVGWLSQVERGLSEPSGEDLGQLAAMLDVPLASLVQTAAPDGEEGYVVRKGAHRPIGARVPGLYESLLSPDLTDDFELLHCRFEPGATQPDMVTRPTQEVGVILSGGLDLWIEEQKFRLGEGDSFRIRGERFRWENPHDMACMAIWAIAPPVY